MSTGHFKIEDKHGLLSREALEFCIDRLIPFNFDGFDKIEFEKARKDLWSFFTVKRKRNRVIVRVKLRDGFPHSNSVAFTTRRSDEGAGYAYVHSVINFLSMDEQCVFALFHALFYDLRKSKQVGGRVSITNANRYAAQALVDWRHMTTTEGKELAAMFEPIPAKNEAPAQLKPYLKSS